LAVGRNGHCEFSAKPFAHAPCPIFARRLENAHPAAHLLLVIQSMLEGDFMRRIGRFTRVIPLLALLLFSSRAGAETLNLNLTFEAKHQSMWGPGAAAGPSTTKLVLIDPTKVTWNVQAPSNYPAYAPPGGIFTADTYFFGEKDFGIGARAKTSGKIGLSTTFRLEDPTTGLEDMAEVRRRLLADGISTPLASNVAVTSFADIPRSVQLDAVQIILCDHHYWGGMRQVQQLARLAKTFGLGLSMHSNSHLGVSLMAMAHVAAATPHLTYACDTHYPWQSEKDEVVSGGRVPIVSGCVQIPNKPGLGVELDYDQLARGRERYATCPYRKRDDEAEMRKHVDPAWTRKLPRW
jgi:hypothetical protein